MQHFTLVDNCFVEMSQAIHFEQNRAVVTNRFFTQLGWLSMMLKCANVLKRFSKNITITQMHNKGLKAISIL